jgi:leucyl aminopeptidase
MIFNLKLNAIKEVKKFPSNSAELIFCKSYSEFEQIIKNRGLKASTLQKKNFKDSDSSEIKIWSDKDPQLTIIKGIELNDKFNVDFFRNYLSGIIKSIEDQKITSVLVNIPKYSGYNKYFNDEKYFLQTIIEGILLGNYNFNKYKADRKRSRNLSVYLISSDKKAIDASIKRAKSVIDGVYFARDLVNEPANVLTPAEYAKRVRSEFRGSGISVRIWDEK